MFKLQLHRSRQVLIVTLLTYFVYRLVDALKAEKPITSLANASYRTNSQKSLGELEKTINALKVVIDKLQSENKKLKSKPHSGTLPPTASSERLKVN
jgi:hypothetical protein